MNKEEKQEIIDSLNLSMISSSIPVYIKRAIQDTASHGSMTWVHQLPLTGPAYGLTVEYRLCPDGSLQMEMRNSDGSPFWRGTFR